MYSLGDIVHNKVELGRLEALGLKILDRAHFDKLHGAKVLIRAHGEPPATYEEARTRDIRLLDATCPVVLRLQARIRAEYQRLRLVGGQVVIYGQPGHAEVNGLLGQTEGHALIVAGPDDLDKIDYLRPVTLFAQTTRDPAAYARLCEEVRQRMARAQGLPAEDSALPFRCEDTICRQVSQRRAHIARFAASYDLVLFVSSRQSSNGKVLFDICRAQNPRTHFIERKEDLRPEWLAAVSSVGVCGATSTPKWLMEEVAEHVRKQL